jgi:hypothetical protein
MKRLLPIILIIILASCAAPFAPTQPSPIPSSTPFSTPMPTPTPIPGVLFVDPGQNLGPISPYIFGSNFGPWTSVSLNMLDYAVNAHITALRWPGGEWGDQNDIQPSQLDFFMTFCQSMGAIPTISVRLLDGTPEKAAELVRYANLEKKYGIVYWSIGNEPQFYAHRPNVDGYDTVRFNQEWRSIALAMEAVDPSIKLVGPEVGAIEPGYQDMYAVDANGLGWMKQFLIANGDLVDVVTYHRYTFPRNNKNASVDDLRADTATWPETVRLLRQMIQETTGRDLPIAITEANSHYTAAVGGEGTPDSFYNAIWWGDILGRLINEEVFMVNQFLLANNRGGLGLLTAGAARPTYYVYQMYSHFGSQRVYAASGMQGVNIYAARTADGKLTLMVINLLDSDQSVPLRLQEMVPARAEVWRLDAAHNAESLGTQSLPPSGLLVLPAHSMTLYVIAP